MIGKTLGHYQITSQLGKGGMGEVFQAKDQVLGRDVAIKVLPEEFARDTDRVARFQREAKVLASLNHPNIAAIYGLEQSEGKNFLVLELVEGQTLADRIKTGPIPAEESLKLALQIAEALEAAHEKGVIHRDLKPANIKVTPDGKVKVLDFGLAKAYAGEQEQVNLSNSPTLSDAATKQGVILGTAAYMSPEQARGESVDKKADIWAFGCVLFEMLTGRATFEGRTVSDVLASVIKSEPEWKMLPPNLHPRIRILLERCLEKEAKNRYHDIADGRVDIQKALTDPSGVFVQPVTAVQPRGRLRTILPWIAAAIILGAIIAGVAVWKLKPAEPHQVTRFYYELPKGHQLISTAQCSVAISPDGRQLAYATSDGIYLRFMDQLDARLIPGTGRDPDGLFFSPDGKWIGYVSGPDKRLKKIAVIGGAPVALTNDVMTVWSSWSADDTIVYSGGAAGGIMRISSNGGTPETIVKAQNEILVSPQLLPDGESVLFTSIATSPHKIMLQSLKSGERKELLVGGDARYLPSGHLVYSLEDATDLFAVPFDVGTLRVTGGPVSVVQGVFRYGGAPQWDVSNSGTLVYVSETEADSYQSSLVWVDRNGREEPITAEPHNYSSARISPDGTKVALHFGTAGGGMDIWIWDLVRKTMTRLTLHEGDDENPVWTHDSKGIFFSSDREGMHDVYWKAADGTGEEKRIGSAPDRLLFPMSLSGDGKTLVLSELNLKTGISADIGALSIEGDHKWMPLLQEKYTEEQPQISPDGRWMAYVSNESGQSEIYVRPFPDVDGGKWQISSGGGYSPLWSRDCRELFYRNGDAVVAVSVKSDQTFGIKTSQTLFRRAYIARGNESETWDISPDGKRFLMIKPPVSTGGVLEAAGPRKINIVLNWLEELKQRVPVK